MFNGRPTNGRWQSETFYQQLSRGLVDAVASYHRNRKHYTLAGELRSFNAGV